MAVGCIFISVENHFAYRQCTESVVRVALHQTYEMVVYCSFHFTSDSLNEEVDTIVKPR